MRLHQLDGAGLTPAPPIRVLVDDSTVCSVALDLEVPCGVEVTLVPVVEEQAGTSLDERVRHAVAVAIALAGSWQSTL